jgi:hypothetical protein
VAEELGVDGGRVRSVAGRSLSAIQTSGTRPDQHRLNKLGRRGRYALAAMCAGGRMANAAIIERLD